MYSLAEFEEYTLRKSLGTPPVLAWSRKYGYHFLDFLERMEAMAEGDNFKIVGIERAHNA